MTTHGREYLAIPGPSVIPDAVLRAMHRASPNIYTGELHDLTHSLIPDLKTVAQTEGHVAIYIGNGHAAWEAALVNVVNPGDKVLVLSTGLFAHSWSGMAEKLGLDVEIMEFGPTSAVDADAVQARLQDDTGGEIKAVLAVQVDTSTSVKSDIAAISRAISASDHPALLMVDCIACLGCDDFQMDAWGVDVMVAACQKGLMTPPGVSFVFFNDKAAATRDRITRVSGYWDWQPRAKPDLYYQYFAGTAPTHHLYGLRAALDMILDEGLDHVFARHAHLAQTLWTAVDVWGAEGPLALNVPNVAERSHAVTSLAIGAPHGDALRAWCEENAGVTLGIGLGRDPASGFFRVGHMGHVNGQMMMAVLGTIDAGLKALDIPHGRGALEAASARLAAGA